MIILPDHFYFSIDQTQNLQKIPTLRSIPPAPFFVDRKPTPQASQLIQIIISLAELLI